MCPACWDLRATTVGAQGPAKPSTALFTASLVLGIISFVPFPALMLVSFVLGIVAIVQAKGPMEHQRWKGIVGLSLTCLSGLGWILVLAFSS